MLISGIVGYRAESYFPKPGKKVLLYVTVLFYSVFIAVVVQLISPQMISVFDMLVSFFPIVTKRYWFFSSYFVVLLFSPLINCIVNKYSAKYLSGTCLIIFFIGAIEIVTKVFSLSSGYSFVWLSFLYFIGAVIKKYDLFDKISVFTCVCFVFGSIFINWLIKMCFPTINFEVSGINIRPGNVLISYCSPTVLIMALGWVCIFYKIKIHKCLTRIIAFFSSSAFSVYLIHDNEIVRRVLIKNKFTFLLDYNPFVMAIGVLFWALIIFMCCICIDKLRMILFDWLKIHVLSVRMEKMIMNKYDCLFNKVKRLFKYE